mmetsp:Transcript_14715/g.33790  ORF Transcript_14715/g.33790 Transcript_14715/m.33790 type:complete len:228 (-) Transcript_14715:624-1307(-)
MQFAELPFISNIWPLKTEAGSPKESVKAFGKFSASNLEMKRSYEEAKQRISAKFESDEHVWHDDCVLYEVKMQQILRSTSKENFSAQKHSLVEDDYSSDTLSQESTPDGSCTVLKALDVSGDATPVVDLQILSVSEAAVEDAKCRDAGSNLDDDEVTQNPEQSRASADSAEEGREEEEEEEISECFAISHEELMRNIDEALINSQLAVAECQFEIRRSCGAGRSLVG